MKDLTNQQLRQAVRENYGEIAKADSTGCGCGCGTGDTQSAEEISMALGYSETEVSGVPKGANMGLGCGNPGAIASIRPGETVLDLGSGGGFDCFLAAGAAGETGTVIGVDMTPEMINKARTNAETSGFNNVRFRLGEIEHLPVEDRSVDVIISNCVINLSPRKDLVFRDAFRVLKSGGRLAVSDIVTTATLPEEVKNDLSLYTGCVSGASSIDELESLLGEAGFTEIRIAPKDINKEVLRNWAPGTDIGEFVVSASIEAVKP